MDTYLLWEHDRTKPCARYYPALFQFLGYDPLPEPQTLGERLKRKRWALGLTIEGAAGLLGVDAGTFRRWEWDEWKPRMSESVVERFLAMTVDQACPI